MGEPWDPSQPLRAGASDEQLYARMEHLRHYQSPWWYEPAVEVARELAAAETAALREKLSRVTAERDALCEVNAQLRSDRDALVPMAEVGAAAWKAIEAHRAGAA